MTHAQRADLIWWSLAVLSVLAACLAVWLAVAGESRRNRLLAECLNDGHREYECAGMLRSGYR